MDHTDFQRDTAYWNSFYKTNLVMEPSRFARYAAGYMKSGRVLDLGCGNGRDSIYFAGLSLSVTAIDASGYVIEKLMERHTGIQFICGDFVEAVQTMEEEADYCYSRFSIHAIDDCQQEMLLNGVYRALKPEGLFFVEARSIKDAIYGKGEAAGRHAYIYEGHYRRFLDKGELESALQKAGFQIQYAEESDAFAPFAGSSPVVVRITAKKTG